MLQKILVPLDGSPLSEAALPYAEAMASKAHAKLMLARMAHPPVLPSEPAQLRALTEADEYLSAHAAELTLRGLGVETSVSYRLTAATWIAKEACIRHADLVVMATHGRIGPNRWLRGSVAEEVVSLGVAPVMLVRAADGMRAVEHLEWQKPVVVVPLDGSPLAQGAVSVAADLAALRHIR